MSIFTGTVSTDRLIGTNEADLFLPGGVARNEVPDYMSGLGGADIYDLAEPIGEDPLHRYIIEDAGGDGAVDRILHAGQLASSASLGYLRYVEAERVGDDLVIVTPSKPHRYRDPAKPSFEITIVDHFAGDAVEWLESAGTEYHLTAGTVGLGVADLLAGGAGDEVLRGLGGDDFILGNGGRDTLKGGAGEDHLFGGRGRDALNGGSGNDRMYGGAGRDKAKGKDGNDFLYLEDGNDHGMGGAGNDYIYGQAGNDTLIGGGGADLLSGGAGDDRMKGGTGGDTYRYGYDVDALGSMSDAGHDRIRDVGEKASWNDYDRIELFGFYGPSDGELASAYASLSFVRDGVNMVMDVNGGQGSITVAKQFGAAKFAIEEVEFYAGYWTPLRFKVLNGERVDIGDDRGYPGGINGEWNEILFGTDGDDQVFGNSGTNFIWLGAGADTLVYKEADPQVWSGVGGGACNDIVEDFDVTQDRLDFTEMKGLGLTDLVITQDATGDAHIFWGSRDFEIADIGIELRGVGSAEVTADLFVFG